MAKKTVFPNESEKVHTLFKTLNNYLRTTYGATKTSHVLPLSLDENWYMMGKTVATFTTMGIYFYQRCYTTVALKSAKGGLWLEYLQTTTFNGKKIRKGTKVLVESIEQLAELLEWLTSERDILCKNDDHWEYADEFHLWTFST